MNFSVDAQFPPALSRLLVQHGHDAIHTDDLPAASLTRDRVINQISLDEERVVVSKDSDFY